MKKILMVSLLLLIGLLVAVNNCKAEVTTKAGILYELQDKERLEVVGTSVIQDVAGIKGLDIDALIGSEIETMLSDDDKIALTGISYNYDINDKLSVGVGGAIGLKRIEKLESGRTGEFKGGIYLVGAYRF